MDKEAERRVRIAELEIALRGRAGLIASVCDGWTGAASRAGPPDVTLEYRAVDGYLGEQPEGREYPAYGCRASSPRVHELRRHDSHGQVAIPVDDAGPVLARFEGAPQPWVIEAALRVVLSVVLPRRGGLILHATAVAGPKGALLFLGRSGAGKTTIADLVAGATAYRRRLGHDLTIVTRGATGWRAHPTPLAREPVEGDAAPIAGVHFLVQAPFHRAQPVPRAAAVPRVLASTLAFPGEPEAAGRLLDTAARLAGEVPCFVLEFARNAGVAQVLGIT